MCIVQKLKHTCSFAHHQQHPFWPFDKQDRKNGKHQNFPTKSICKIMQCFWILSKNKGEREIRGKRNNIVHPTCYSSLSIKPNQLKLKWILAVARLRCVHTYIQIKLRRIVEKSAELQFLLELAYIQYFPFYVCYLNVYRTFWLGRMGKLAYYSFRCFGLKLVEIDTR